MGAAGYGGEWSEERIQAVAEVIQGVRDHTHWEDSKEAMREYLTKNVDKEIHDTYMSDDAEREKVWKALLSAVTE